MSAGVELVHVGFDFKKLINQKIAEAAGGKNELLKMVRHWRRGQRERDQIYSKK